jgi:phosphoribosylaminoimidazolecarboxamide formyltransferase/IMP cyclohydrolase
MSGAERKSGVRRRALLSVTDKSGIVEFARGLAKRDFELLSTGGTAKAIREAGLAVTDVSEATGFPEMMDGRVKTLHPAIHGGLLALRDEPSHRQAMDAHGIGAIDVVAVNLYAFRETVAKPGVTDAEAVENIDIGGPSMIRSAAKNHRFVWIVTDPVDYDAVLAGLDAQKDDTNAGLALRRELAGRAYATTAAYDAAITGWFGRTAHAPQAGEGAASDAADATGVLPETLAIDVSGKRALRYGENPGQQGAFYARAGGSEACIARAQQLSGKELSYNNILDADAALELVKEFDAPTVAVIKHSNPCGCATADDLAEAFLRAWDGDPLSAFGGILALNRPLGPELAERIATKDRFLELIVAPEFADGAVEILATRTKWGKNLRLLECGPLDAPREDEPIVRSVTGGFLVQQRDVGFASETRKVASTRAPSEQERADLEFCWRVAKHVKSNAIVLAKDGMIVGVGAGQMSRVDSVQLAGRKAGERSRGAVLASDAFFPFRDAVDEAAQLGVTAIIQPGGSIRDKQSVEAAEEHGMAMLFTGSRHFRH